MRKFDCPTRAARILSTLENLSAHFAFLVIENSHLQKLRYLSRMKEFLAIRRPRRSNSRSDRPKKRFGLPQSSANLTNFSYLRLLLLVRTIWPVHPLGRRNRP